MEQWPFKHHHVLLPVIHVRDSAQALRNSNLARRCGADGCFLINHGMNWEELAPIAAEVITLHNGWWIGVNLLGLSPEYVFTHAPAGTAGIWADNAEVEEDP